MPHVLRRTEYKGFLSLIVLIALLFIPATVSWGQSTCSPTLSRSDCNRYIRAIEDFSTAESMSIRVALTIDSDVGNISNFRLEMLGDGWVIFDDAGQIDVLDVLFPRTTISSTSMLTGTSVLHNALHILIRDDMLYVGTGSNADSLIWGGADLNAGQPINRSLSSLFPTLYLSDAPGTPEWERIQDLSIDGPETYSALAAQIVDGQPYASAFAQIGGLLGGPPGSMEADAGALFGALAGDVFAQDMGLDAIISYTGILYLNETTGTAAGFMVNTEVIVDMSAMMRRATGGDPLFDLLGSAFIGTDTRQNFNFTLFADEFNGDYSTLITEAPEAEIIADRQTSESIIAPGREIGFMPIFANLFAGDLVLASSRVMSGNVPPTLAATNTPGPSPTPSQTPTPTITPTITLTPSPTLTLVPCEVTTSTNINLRSGPGTNFDTLGRLTPSQVAQASGQETGPDGFVWWRLDDGTWARSDLVRTSRDCSDLPVVSEGRAPALAVTMDIVCNVTTRFGVNLRTGPGTNFPQTGSRRGGDTFRVDAQFTGGDGFTWWRVADGSIDDGLWVREDLVNEAGPCTSLPVVEP